MTLFALVDANNFFVSCERVFNPRLEGQPVVVLSNNDGNVVARSNEVKRLGVPMAAPYHEWRDFFKKHHVQIYSTNSELYVDMSRRIMISLEQLYPIIEVYSIDEAFLDLSLVALQGLQEEMVQLRSTIKQWLGIPISIGLAPTKTLAKIANHIAKKHTRSGVFDLRDATWQQRILTKLPINEIWGIGRKLAEKLQDMHIHTARDLRDADPKLLRKRFGVTMERIVYELRGISCLPLEAMQPKQQIICSRSFGKSVTEFAELTEALSHFAAKACMKLRQQKSRAGGIAVFLNTNYYRTHDKQYGNSQTCFFPEATQDTGFIITTATRLLRQIFKSGYNYHKTGIMLLDLLPEQVLQIDMLTTKNHARSAKLMEAVDKINHTQGKGSVIFASEGVEHRWQRQAEHRSKRYTTCWQDLPIVIS